MSIRFIDYIVTAAGITPATVQKGGLQGEHRATTLRFSLEEGFRYELPKVADKIWYRFEAYTSSGLKNSTDPECIIFSQEGRFVTLEYPLENWLTRDGGNIRVYLIFSGLNMDDDKTIDLYTYPALLRLEAVPDAEFTDGENYESITTLSVAARDSAARAEAAADAANDSAEAADEAREKTETARFALENGAEFVILGGDAAGSVGVELVIDEELSDVSENLVKNKGIAAAINAAKDELKAYTDNEIATFDFIKIVGSLEKTGLPNRLYLVPKSDAEGNDLFDEYIWANGAWEFITTKQIDLTPYVRYDSIGDYIVEQGTSGIWTYRKWNSGIIECWGRTKGNTAYGDDSDISSTTTLALPCFFYTTQSVNVQAIQVSESGWKPVKIIPTIWNNTNAVSFTSYCDEGQDSSDINYSIEVKGTWK